MLRNLLLATCVAAIPSAALAQTATQNATPQNVKQGQMAGKFLAMPAAGQIRAADLRSADIYTADNQKVGDIDDILLDSRGNIVAVVVGVGGFLGIGEKNVAIPFESLDMMAQNNMAGAAGTTTRTTGTTTGAAGTAPNTANRDGMTTGAVPNNTAAATDQDRQRATAQRAEQMSREQLAAQRGTATTTTTTTTATNQRMAQTGGAWKPERILLKGVTKAELESAPAFNWDASAIRGATPNTPARNR